MILKKKNPASACRKKKTACRTNVIESLWEKKGKKYPAHKIARKKILDDQKFLNKFLYSLRKLGTIN